MPNRDFSAYLSHKSALIEEGGIWHNRDFSAFLAEKLMLGLFGLGKFQGRMLDFFPFMDVLVKRRN